MLSGGGAGRLGVIITRGRRRPEALVAEQEAERRRGDEAEVRLGNELHLCATACRSPHRRPSPSQARWQLLHGASMGGGGAPMGGGGHSRWAGVAGCMPVPTFLRRRISVRSGGASARSSACRSLLRRRRRPVASRCHEGHKGQGGTPHFGAKDQEWPGPSPCAAADAARAKRAGRHGGVGALEANWRRRLADHGGGGAAAGDAALLIAARQSQRRRSVEKAASRRRIRRERGSAPAAADGQRHPRLARRSHKEPEPAAGRRPADSAGRRAAMAAQLAKAMSSKANTRQAKPQGAQTCRGRSPRRRRMQRSRHGRARPQTLVGRRRTVPCLRSGAIGTIEDRRTGRLLAPFHVQAADLRE